MRPGWAGLALSLLLPATARGAGERIVVISHGGVGNPFWSVVFNGAKQAAKDLGVQLQVLFPNNDGDQPGTTQKLAEAISTKPDAIAVTFATPAHCEYIQEARRLGIPLLVYNARALPSGPKCPYQAYVGMDEYEAGRVSARRAWESGRVKGRVLVGLTEAGHAGLQARAKGVTDVLKAKGVAVDVLDLGNDPASIPARYQGYLAAHKGSVTGFFIPSPNGVHPLIRMMREDPSGVGKAFVASFDLTPLILKAIEEGLVEHTVDQQPYLQGYYAVAQLAMAVRGKFTPIEMNTGVGLVHKGNAAAVAELVKQGVR